MCNWKLVEDIGSNSKFTPKAITFAQKYPLAVNTNADVI